MNVADDRDEVLIVCEVRFRRIPGDAPPIVRARRWFKHSLRAYGGHMLSSRRVDLSAGPPPAATPPSGPTPAG